MQLIINSINYTTYIASSSNPVLTDPLNESKTFVCAVTPADSAFVPPLFNQYVQILNNENFVFTGYITNSPQLSVLASGVVGYTITCQSEDFVFSQKITNPPVFTGQYAGTILTDLLNSVANINYLINTANVPQGPFVPYFAVQSGWNFVQAAQSLSEQIGFYWYILNHNLYFVPINDTIYGYSIEENSVGFQSSQLVIDTQNSILYKDISIFANNEPTNFVQENYWGDGKTKKYTLSQTLFGNQTQSNEFNDSFFSSQLSPEWTLINPSNNIVYQQGNVSVTGASGNLNSNVLYLTNGFELGGELLFDSGTFTFQNLSVGVVGGIYNTNAFNLNNCIAGIYLTGNTPTTGILPIVNGAILNINPLVTQAGYSYNFQVYFSCDELYRYYEIYRCRNGLFGGQSIPSGAFITVVVNITDTQGNLTQNILYDNYINSISPFGYFCLLNSNGMYLTNSGKISINTLPTIRVRSLSNGRIFNPTLYSFNNSVQLSIPNPIAINDAISFTYRQTGPIQVDLQNFSLTGPNIANGTASLATLGRNTEDYENLAKAFLTDNDQYYYAGNYLQSTTLTITPRSGRYVFVSVPTTTTNNFSSLVNQVVITITNFQNNSINLQTYFGFNNLSSSFPVSLGNSNLTPEDFTLTPLSLNTEYGYSLTSVTGSQINISAQTPPLAGYEIRYSDSGWGQGNFVAQVTTQNFALARPNQTQNYFIREYDSGLVPKYSRYSYQLNATGYPITPASVSGSTITVSTNVTFTINISNPLDVYGVQILEPDNATVFYNALYQGNNTVVYTVPNTSLSRTFDNYYFYTYNIRNEFSSPVIVSGNLPAPLAPTISFSSQDNTSFTLSISTENRTDIIEQVLEVATDTAFTNIIFSDTASSQYGSVTFAVPADGTYYVRCQRSDELGYGPWTNPLFQLNATGVNPVTAAVIQGATGVNPNLIPDSGLQFGATYWPNYPVAGISILTSVGLGTANGFEIPASYSGTFAQAVSIQFQLIAGQEYTLSGYVDATYVTSGHPGWAIYNPALTTEYGQAVQSPGNKGRVVETFTFSPSGVTAGTAVLVVALFDCFGSVFSGGPIIGSTPMLQAGGVMTAYLPNVVDNITGYIKRGAHPPEYNNVITSTSEISGVTTISGGSGNPVTTIDQGATGTNPNLVPDSNIQFGSTYWSLPNANWSIGNGLGYQGLNAIQVSSAQTGGPVWAESQPIPVTPGQEYVLSAYIDATFCSSILPGILVLEYTGGTSEIVELDAAVGTKGRIYTTFTVPTGITEIVLLIDTRGTTIASGEYLRFSAPMLQAGGVMTAYLPNVVDNITGYIKRGAHPPEYNNVINISGNLNTNVQQYDPNSVLRTPYLIDYHNASNIGYQSGATVESLQPAQAGADVTASNTNILLQNPNFLSGNVGWGYGPGFSIGNTGITGPNGETILASYTGSTNSINNLVNNQHLLCSPNMVIAASLMTMGESGAPGTAYVFVNFYNGSGGYIDSYLGNAVSPNTGWNQSRVVTPPAPANTVYAVVGWSTPQVSTVPSPAWYCSEFTAAILPNSIDEVPNGVTYIKPVAVDSNGQTTTPTYAPNSVTSSVGTSITTQVSIGTTNTLLASVTINTNGGYCAVAASGILFNTNTTGTLGANMTIYKGNSSGTGLYAGGQNGTYVPAQDIPVQWCVAPIIDTSPAASQEYSIYGVAPSSGLVIDTLIFTVQNFKA